MPLLSYQALKDLNYQGFLLPDAPERVLQFGEGGFLRGFAEDFIDRMNEQAGFDAKVVMVQPIPHGLCDAVNRQQGLYTLYLRGLQEGAVVSEKRVISCVSRCIDPYRDFSAFLQCAENPHLRFIISNTTEAGIVFDESCRYEDAPPHSFPAKLTRFLHERYEKRLPGFIILSCELIDDNGEELRRCVDKYAALWGLSEDFRRWLDMECLFCSTLVDRIVTGYPREEAQALNQENGYEDTLIDTAELFGFWVIQGPDSLREVFPAERVGLPVRITSNHKPYKQRKVRILNGAHTAMVSAAFLSGQDTVGETMSDGVMSAFLRRTIYKEIIPTLDLPRGELEDFAASVFQRFANPYIRHQWQSIALNGASKWRARLLPSLTAYYQRFGAYPSCITAAFAAFTAFYRGGYAWEGDALLARSLDRDYVIRDDSAVLEFFLAHREDGAEELCRHLTENHALWGGELAALPGFSHEAAQMLRDMDERGVRAVLADLARDEAGESV